MSDEDNSAPPSIGLDRRVAEKEINLTKQLKAFITKFSVNFTPCVTVNIYGKVKNLQ